EGQAVYGPENKRQFAAHGTVYHPFSWRGWWDYGSGALGDIAPHSMNVIFLSLNLGAPSSIEVVDTSGMKKEMYPDWSILRFQWAARGKHPPLTVYWYDGGLPLPKEMRAPQPPESPATGSMPLRRGQGGMVWIGTKGSYPAGRGPFAGKETELPTPPEREWG